MRHETALFRKSGSPEIRTQDSRLKAGCSTAELATLARLGMPISAPKESITWSAINKQTDGQ